MLDAETKTKPSVTYATEERLFATRYKQGGRTVFSVALTPDQIINLVKRPDPSDRNPGNRQVRPKHAQGFADYYLSHDNWVIPGIILRAPTIFAFEADLDAGDGTVDFGVVSYPKRSQSEIHILDGQHRILGFHLALRDASQAVDKAADHRARVSRTEGKDSIAMVEAEQALAAARDRLERFYRERVSVEIQVTDDLREYRQMFFDIADNALGITASVKARFDSTKVINRALAAVLEHPLLQNRVSMEVDRLGQTSNDLLSARHVTEIMRARLVGIDGRVGKRLEAVLVDTQVAQDSLDFFTMLADVFPPLMAVQLGQITVPQLRATTLLGSPLMLRILAGVAYELKANHGFSNQMIREYFEALAPHMLGAAHANSIWILHAPEDTFDVGAHGPNGRRQDSAALTKAIWEWAVDGESFVTAPPLPEPEEQKPEAIDYSDLGDDALAARLQAEDEAAGISASK